ncbi:hypothetical protein [Blastococcus sp. TF02A-30]|uniref:hypothetical protein n=1 Tax=Blastococcus sp. TF02A-30 TaxID=2250580 RepID=UPI000DE9DEEF|nr:hypothetical protein [Blastococcus sp. TF02A-30]RBY84145.1 hypothetical protein DQ241_19040 [Blastococcus sp. TF02A-30]
MQVGRPSIHFQAATPPYAHSANSSRGAAATGDFGAALASASAAQELPSEVSDADRYAPRPGSLLSYLTPADRQMLAAATGFQVSSDGVVQNPGPHPVHPLLSEVAINRMTGHLEGGATASYLTDLFAKYKGDAELGSFFTDDVLGKALDHLSGERRRRESGDPASNFSLRL